MSLWAKVQEVQASSGDAMKQLQTVYGVHFPIEVRYFFAEWIEEQPWGKIDEENTDHEPFALELVNKLIEMLQEKANELNAEDNFLNKIRLQETTQQFREMYSNRPMSLVRVVKNCLDLERRLVQQAQTQPMGECKEVVYHRRITESLETLTNQIREAELETRQIQQNQEDFVFRYQESMRLNAQIQQIGNMQNGQSRVEDEKRLRRQKQTLDTQLAQRLQELVTMRMKVMEKHQNIFTQLSELQKHILDEQLISWKRQQQLAGNGAPFEGSLETLQGWCKSLAELITQNRQQISKLQLIQKQLPLDNIQGEQEILEVLMQSITGLLSNLVTSTFIIEKQPPQVLKKDSRFTATVRLLVGEKLNLHMNPPTVKATIISEEIARSLMSDSRQAKNETSGDVLNNMGTMEYHQVNGQLAVTFRNMTLRRIKRAEKRGNETVTEEKFSILFQSEFKVGGGELVFQVWTLSLPVVVTVHGNQECNALATVLWDNAFAEPCRTLFTMPERVSWPQLAQALNVKFSASCGAEMSLQNQNYLASKLFGQADEYSKHVVTWMQFNREPLQGRNFTFWEWFYSILKLTKDWLADPWKEALIMGFVAKQEAQEQLMQRPNGTFLLRFSDSELGGITIAWVADDTNRKGERLVWNLAPFTEKDFRIRSLGDRIKDLPNLVYLFPNIPKATAFSKFWTEPPDLNNSILGGGYVRPDLTTVIPQLLSQPAAPMMYDDERTPQVMQPQSPENPSDDTEMAVQPGSQAEAVGSLVNQMDDLWEWASTDYNTDDITQIPVADLLRLMPDPSFENN